MSTNMNYFNSCCARILINLHESFPIPMTLRSEDYHILEGPEEDIILGPDIFSGTVAFLKKEGFITHGVVFYGGYEEVQLTLNGLMLLDSTPEVLEKSIYRYLKDMVKQESPRLASQILYGIFTAVLKS